MPKQTMNPITPQVGGGGEEEISKLTEQISK
jgi:hypothetical protein